MSQSTENSSNNNGSQTTLLGNIWGGIRNRGARAFGSTWNGLTWVGGNVGSWVHDRAINSWAYNAPGAIRGACSGLASIPDGIGAARESISAARNLVGTVSNGEARAQIQTMLEQALIRQSPPEVIQLKALLSKLLATPDTITAAEVGTIGAHLNLLAENDDALLHQLAPELGEEGVNIFRAACQRFTTVVSGLNVAGAEETNLNLFKASIGTDDVRVEIQAIDTLIQTILVENRGALVKVMAYLQEALLPESDARGETNNGMIASAIDILNRKLLGPSGMLETFNDRLTNEETGILRNAVDYLQRKLMERGGLVDQLDQRITGQAHPLLSSARTKLNDLRAAVTSQNQPLTQRHAQELRTLLEQIATNCDYIFTRGALPESDREILNQLHAKLSQFYEMSPLNQSEMLLSIEGGASVINRYYGSYEGLAARTGAMIADVINPLLTRVENLPQTLYNNVNAALGRTSTNTTTTPQPENGESNGSTLSGILGYGSNVLKSLLDQGSEAVSMHALSSFAKATTIILEMTVEKMGNATLAGPKQEIENIIRILKQTQQNGDWNAWVSLYTTIKGAAVTLNSLNKTIFNIPIPQFGTQGGGTTNLEKHYSDNISALRRAKKPQIAQPQNENWVEKVKDEKDKLVDNATRLLAIKKTFESPYICGLIPDNENFYRSLLTQANQRADARYLRPGERVVSSEFKELHSACAGEALQELFFAEIKNRISSPLTRLWAHIVYYFMTSLGHTFILNAATNYFTEIFKYIEENKDEEHSERSFDALRNQLTKNFTRYLTYSNSAYDNIAKDLNAFGTLDEMHNARMEKKEANRGFDTDELYSKLGKTIADETFPTIQPFKFVSTLPSFLQSILAILFMPITWPLSWLGGKFLTYMQWHPKDIIRTLVDTSVGGLQDTLGYTHALNCVIREELEAVLEILKNPDANLNSNDLSDIKKKQLRELVKNLFEVLSKNKCSTVSELRDLIEGKDMVARANAAIDSFFIEDVIEQVTNLLASTVQTLLNEDQLQKLTYKFANLVNSTFQDGAEPTLQEMEEEERKIKDLSGQILRLTVNSAVEEKFDFSGKKEQIQTNDSIQKLKALSQELIQGTETDPGVRQGLAALATMDVSSQEGQNKMDAIVAKVLAYETQCSEESFKAKGSTLSYDNKLAIRERYCKMAEHSQPFVSAVTQMKTQTNLLENLQGAAARLSAIREIMAHVALRVFPIGEIPSDENLDFGWTQVGILEGHLIELKRIGMIPEFTDQIQEQITIIGELVVAQTKATKMQTFCTAQLMPNSTLQQIANEKRAQLLPGAIPNAQLNDRIGVFQEEIRLSVDNSLLPNLLRKLEAIATATTNAQIDTGTQEFADILTTQAIPQARRAFENSARQYPISHQRIREIIDTSNLLDPQEVQTVRDNISESIEQAKELIEGLAACETTIKPVAYLDIAPISLKSLEEFASNIVFNRVNERLDGAIGLIKQEETYRHGLINHLFLIPFLEARQVIQIDPLSGMKKV